MFKPQQANEFISDVTVLHLSNETAGKIEKSVIRVKYQKPTKEEKEEITNELIKIQLQSKALDKKREEGTLEEDEVFKLDEWKQKLLRPRIISIHGVGYDDDDGNTVEFEPTGEAIDICFKYQDPFESIDKDYKDRIQGLEDEREKKSSGNRKALGITKASSKKQN